MAKECIIHIGMPKAGSSSIQNFMFAYREYFLKKHDINYYSACANHSHFLAALSPYGSHYLAKRELYSKKDIDEFKARTWSDFNSALDVNQSKLFVISGERFSQLTAGGIAHIKEIISKHFDRTQIVFYAREPYGFARSSCQQYFKTGTTFKALIENTYLTPHKDETADNNEVLSDSLLPHYRARLENYIEAFGRKNVIVRDFTRKSLINEDVIDDFIKGVLNVKLERGSLPPIDIDQNTSIDHQLAWSYERINRLHPRNLRIKDNWYPNPLRARTITTLMKKYGGTENKFRLVNFDWDAFSKAVAPDMEWLKKTTDGKIDYTDLPVPKKETDTSFDQNIGLANLINEVTLKSKRQAHQINILTKARSNKEVNLVQIDSVILQAVTPAPLFRFARGLKNAGLREHALKAAEKGLYLCGLDPELKDDFETLVAALNRNDGRSFSA